MNCYHTGRLIICFPDLSSRFTFFSQKNLQPNRDSLFFFSKNNYRTCDFHFLLCIESFMELLLSLEQEQNMFFNSP